MEPLRTGGIADGFKDIGGTQRELGGPDISYTDMRPDPDFEEFARDFLQLARREKSLQRRSRLLVLAREWMHAAMQERPDVWPRRPRGKARDR